MPANPLAVAALPTLVPEKSSIVFDMNKLLDGVLDNGARLELMPEHAPSILTLFARLDGHAVGVLANQPNARGGILDSKASVKAARFVEFCGRFDLPVLTFVDVPGFLPGTVEEGRGVITHGAKLLKAYVDTKSPKLTVVVRKSYGGAYIAMGSASLGADANWAWSNSEIAVMGPGGAVALLHRRALKEAEEPTALRDELAAAYREEVARPYLAAEAGIVDDVIQPEETRDRMVAALRMLSTDRRRDDLGARRDRRQHLEDHLRVGDQVGPGDTLAVLESMKMEIPVVAPPGGHVSKILVEINQIVQEGDPIVEIDDTASA